ncbi:MAG: AAA family ATPase, partial [Alphaproteobacteria bacterium]|nr:AAA family ATPase [Alphaproteobacteria bacterium]
VALLTDRWDLAVNGEAQLVMVCGEPGIGKSRLVEELHDSVADQPCIHIRFQCSPYHANSALYPLTRQLERGAGFAAHDSDAIKLDKLETMLSQGSDDFRHTAALLAPFLGIDTGDRYPKLGMSPRRQKSEAMDAMADYLAGLSTVKPLLMILEDAHWIDPSSEEAMERVVTRMIGHRALLVVTHRPEYTPRWSNLGHATALGLGHLGRHQVKELALQICGDRPLPEAVLTQITARTDGVPLYVEELTKSVIESNAENDALPGGDGGAVPASLRDSLTGRLDRLEHGRNVAQIGACIGRTFSHDMLSAVADMPEDTLQESLEELVQSGLLSRAGAPSEQRYRFKHALVQDAAHDLLLKSRRQAIHGRIADILLRDQKDVAAQVPEVIAQHFAEAGNPAKAVEYWLAAGAVAFGRFAYAEAVEHSNAGLSHLQYLDEGIARDRLELALSLLLGGAYLQVRGFAADQVRDAHTRALSLAEALGDERHTFIALVGLAVWYMVRGPQRRSRELMERLQGVAAKIGEPAFLVVADLLHGILNVFMADNVAARMRLGRVLDLAPSVEPADVIKIVGADPLCQANLWLSIALWRRGYPDQACVHLDKCVARGDAVDHPASRAGARCMGAVTLLERGELEEAVAMAMEGSTYAKEQSLPDWEAIGLGSSGNAMLRMGKIDDAEKVLTVANDMRAVTGNGFHNPELYQGRISLARGDGDAAIAIVDETLPLIRDAGEFWYEVEFLRLKGLALAAKGETHHPAAEAAFLEAIS